MPLMRWDPFTALARLDTEFDDLVRRSFGSAPYQYTPAVEMAAEGADVVITLELPGVDVKDIDIEAAEQVEAQTDKGLLRLRVKNVTKPVVPPRKIEIKGGGEGPKTIESTAKD